MSEDPSGNRCKYACMIKFMHKYMHFSCIHAHLRDIRDIRDIRDVRDVRGPLRERVYNMHV